MDHCDVIVVGGGIAGSAVASVLAGAGVDVLLLETVTEYRDRVRGEYLQPWGVAEMLRMQLETVLLEAGGGWCRRMIGYSEGVDPAAAEAEAVPLDAMVPGAPGGFCVGHPQASEALNTTASARGATVRRGVTGVAVAGGREPRVSFAHQGAVHEMACRLVVGADGRQSIVRRALKIDLHVVESKATLGGMLVRADGWCADAGIIGVEGDRHFLAFPRPGGLVRLYVCRLPSAAPAAPDRARHMLDAYNLACVPGSARLATAEQVGPCAYFPGSDAWTDVPVTDGGVLIGDAAGWNDPILGCGLSIALRDARSVADVLLAGHDWSPDAFIGYVTERAERMRRLRVSAHLSTELHCTFTPAGVERRRAFKQRMATDPLVRALRTVALTGAEAAPAGAFDDDVLTRALAFA